MLRTVSHPGVERLSSIRASEPVVIPAWKASASRVTPRSSRSRRTTAASAGSGVEVRATPETSHATCVQVHAFHHMILTTCCLAHTLYVMSALYAHIVPVRLTVEEWDQLDTLAQLRGVTAETLIREVLRLSPQDEQPVERTRHLRVVHSD